MTFFNVFFFKKKFEKLFSLIFIQKFLKLLKFFKFWNFFKIFKFLWIFLKFLCVLGNFKENLRTFWVSDEFITHLTPSSKQLSEFQHVLNLQQFAIWPFPKNFRYSNFKLFYLSFLVSIIKAEEARIKSRQDKLSSSENCRRDSFLHFDITQTISCLEKYRPAH